MHLSARITLTVLFSTTEQEENRDSVWCQSEGEHPLFKSRGENVPSVQWKGNSFEKKQCKREWCKCKRKRKMKVGL